MSFFMDLGDRATRCRDYASALEEERRKILVFHRELPLSLQLVTHAIESYKQQIGGEATKSDCGPVLEEFLSLRPASSWSEESHRRDDKSVENEIVLDKSPDWLRSVQMWNQDPDPLPKRDLVRKPVAVNVRKLGGAFQPFEKEKHVPIETDGTAPAVSSTVDTTTASLGATAAVVDTEKDMEGHSQSQSHRKSRRCWSQELHRRFLQALQQLGGSHTATPKQIRELMKVDGLTNDEVKSHLQKYRLHTRRPTPTVQSSHNSSPQAPHFVVVGGIWVPPQEYAAAAAAAGGAAQPSEVADAPYNGVYAPVASLPSECISQHKQQRKQSNQSSHNGPLHSVVRCSSSLADDGATNIVSPNSSSSKTVTTSSPPIIRGEEL